MPLEPDRVSSTLAVVTTTTMWMVVMMMMLFGGKKRPSGQEHSRRETIKLAPASACSRERLTRLAGLHLLPVFVFVCALFRARPYSAGCLWLRPQWILTLANRVGAGLRYSKLEFAFARVIKAQPRPSQGGSRFDLLSGGLPFIPRPPARSPASEGGPGGVGP